MKKVKVEIKEEIKVDYNRIKCYSKYKGFPTVEFCGKFKIGKKKVAAILSNIEELQKFVAGNFDEEIKSLEEGEVLEPCQK